MRHSGGIISIARVANTTFDAPIRKQRKKRANNNTSVVCERADAAKVKMAKAKVASPTGLRPNRSERGAKNTVPRRMPPNWTFKEN